MLALAWAMAAWPVSLVSRVVSRSLLVSVVHSQHLNMSSLPPPPPGIRPMMGSAVEPTRHSETLPPTATAHQRSPLRVLSAAPVASVSNTRPLNDMLADLDKFTQRYRRMSDAGMSISATLRSEAAALALSSARSEEGAAALGSPSAGGRTSPLRLPFGGEAAPTAAAAAAASPALRRTALGPPAPVLHLPCPLSVSTPGASAPRASTAALATVDAMAGEYADCVRLMLTGAMFRRVVPGGGTRPAYVRLTPDLASLAVFDGSVGEMGGAAPVWATPSLLRIGSITHVGCSDGGGATTLRSGGGNPRFTVTTSAEQAPSVLALECPDELQRQDWVVGIVMLHDVLHAV